MMEKLIKFPMMFVDRILIPLIQENVQVFAQLSRIDLWNPQIQENYDMIILREDF